MRERLTYEREVALLIPTQRGAPAELALPGGNLAWSRDGETDSELHLSEVSDTSGRQSNTAVAANLLWEIIRIINRQRDVNAADPDKARNAPPWYREHTSLLKEWFVITYGESSGPSRKLPRGPALQKRIDAAFAMTQPHLNVLRERGGKKWRENLSLAFYPKVVELEELAIRTGPVVTRGGSVDVTFPERPPQAVSLAQFFSIVALRESKPIEIQRGYGGYSLGNARAGDSFSTSQKERRLLLWSDGGSAVFFMREGKIYAQSGKGFSEDVILGAFVLAAQNAAGAAMLAQLMVEIGLSFTPWGLLWDGVSALKALTERDWKGAALAILPGPALNLASRTRAFRAVGRGASVAATLAAELAKGTVRFVGRGGYWIRSEFLRGIWVVGKDKSYRFFDEIGNKWHDVKAGTAKDYIKCSFCTYTTRGKNAALIGDVDRIFEDMARSQVYASRGRVLIPRKAVRDVLEAYGDWGDHVVECILNTWSSASNAVKLAEDTLAVAKDLSRIRGRHGYQDAIDIFEDLASSSTSTARGTMFELQWAAKHVEDVAAIGLPNYRKGWIGVGKGLDVLKKNGGAIELKNYNFTSQFYKDDPGRAVARIVRQAKSRLALKRPQVTDVNFIFDSAGGPMPAAFKRELDAALKSLSKAAGRPITYGFWP